MEELFRVVDRVINSLVGLAGALCAWDPGVSLFCSFHGCIAHTPSVPDLHGAFAFCGLDPCLWVFSGIRMDLLEDVRQCIRSFKIRL